MNSRPRSKHRTGVAEGRTVCVDRGYVACVKVGGETQPTADRKQRRLVRVPKSAWRCPGDSTGAAHLVTGRPELGVRPWVGRSRRTMPNTFAQVSMQWFSSLRSTRQFILRPAARRGRAGRRPRPHFDLRLEEDWVLRSWAVPRGLPAGTDKDNLAIEVADHDLELPHRSRGRDERGTSCTCHPLCRQAHPRRRSGSGCGRG